MKIPCVNKHRACRVPPMACRGNAAEPRHQWPTVRRPPRAALFLRLSNSCTVGFTVRRQCEPGAAPRPPAPHRASTGACLRGTAPSRASTCTRVLNCAALAASAGAARCRVPRGHCRHRRHRGRARPPNRAAPVGHWALRGRAPGPRQHAAGARPHRRSLRVPAGRCTRLYRPRRAWRCGPRASSFPAAGWTPRPCCVT